MPHSACHIRLQTHNTATVDHFQLVQLEIKLKWSVQTIVKRVHRLLWSTAWPHNAFLVVGCPLVTHCAAVGVQWPPLSRASSLKALIRNLCVTQIEIECQAKLWNIYHLLGDSTAATPGEAVGQSSWRRDCQFALRITTKCAWLMHTHTHTPTHTHMSICGDCCRKGRRHKLDLPASVRALNRKNVKYL